MKALSYTRKFTAIRSRQASPMSHLDIQFQAQLSDEGFEVHFTAPQIWSNQLEEVANSVRNMLLSSLSPLLYRSLLVEVGSVILEITREGETTQSYRRHYLLATCSGVVLILRSRISDERLSSPWTRIVEPNEIRPEIPVILGPSALLALVAYTLEVTVVTGDTVGWLMSPFLSVVDTPKSPYPPQHYPFTIEGTAPCERTLVEAGALKGLEEILGRERDPIFSLLTRTVHWPHPLSVVRNATYRNLEIHFGPRMPRPPSALVINSLMVRDSPRSGVVAWDAEYSLLDTKFGIGSGRSPLRLICDPESMLAGVCGAVGPLQPALDRNPLDGDSYGLAPPVATNLIAGEVLERKI